MDRRLGGLWRHRAFLHLWGASTIGALGTYVGRLALPTAAIIALDAGPTAVGVLVSLHWLSFPLVGLIAGVVADRFPKRRVMIACDLGRALAIGSVPVAFSLGVPTMAHLYVAAAAAGVLTVFFDAAYRSYLPSLVEKGDLIEGNAKLELGQGAAQVGGPALGGALVQAAGAAVAVAADAFSYLASALCLTSIGKAEASADRAGREGLKAAVREAREGLRFVLCHPVLRPIVAVNTISNFGGAVVEAVALVFAYRLLSLSPGAVGAATAVGSVGFVVGAAFAWGMARRLGMGPTLLFSSLLAASSFFALPLGLLGAPIIFYGLWRLLFGLAEAAYNPSSAGLRQAFTPDELQGRAIATVNAFGYGALGAGSLAGGLLGSWVGLVPTILGGGVLYVLGSLPALSRAVMSAKEPPPEHAEGAVDGAGETKGPQEA